MNLSGVSPYHHHIIARQKVVPNRVNRYTIEPTRFSFAPSKMATSKVFIITGASRGIGAAIAQFLLEKSHKVVLTARTKEPLEGMKKSFSDQVEYIAGDITDSSVSNTLFR